MEDIIQLISEISEWNLDDDAHIVLQESESVIKRLALLGLTLNSSKCELLFLGNQSVVERETILNHVRQICPDIDVTEIDELRILGSPMGDQSLKYSLINRKVALARLSITLASLDTHHALFLLRNAFSLPKLMYLLRTAP